MKLIKKEKIKFVEAIKENDFVIVNTFTDNWRKALDLLHTGCCEDYNYQPDKDGLYISKSNNYEEENGGNYIYKEKIDILRNQKGCIVINDVDFLEKYRYDENS